MEDAGLAAPEKKVARLKAHLVFLDEAGFQLIPSVARTWAPVGETPILTHRTTREKLSVISAITVSPQQRHVGLYYQIHGKNIQQGEAVAFLRHLLHHLRGPIVVLWDNGRQHKGEPIRALCRRCPRLHLAAFPPYTPELNPDEGVWRLSRQTLANACLDDLDHLLTEVTAKLEDLRRAPGHLWACIAHADLPNGLNQ